MNNSDQTSKLKELYELVYNMPVNKVSFTEIALNIINIFIDRDIGDNSSIYLKDEESNVLYLVAARDKKRRAFTASNIKLYSGAKELPFKWYFEEGEGIAGSVHMNKKPVFIEDLYKEKRFVGKSGNKTQLLVIPLLIGQQSIGIINISSFTPKGMGDKTVREAVIKLSSYFALLIQFSKVYSKYLTTSFLFSSLIDYTDKAFLLLDKEDKIISFNSVVSSIFPMNSSDLMGMSLSAFYPRDEKTLRDFIKDRFGSSTFFDDKIIKNKGIISEIPFDDLDNKVVIKAIKEFPDGSYNIFDIVKLKVLNKSEESIGSVEIWSQCQAEVFQKKGIAPSVDINKINKIISRLKMVKNELEAKTSNRGFLLKHLDTVLAELKSSLQPRRDRDLNALICTAFRIYNDYNNLQLSYSSKIPDEVSLELLPYKIIKLFYLIIEIVVQFGNHSKPIKIKYNIKSSEQHAGDGEATLLITNDDLHIPKHFMSEFKLGQRELSDLTDEIKAGFEIIKAERRSTISVTLRVSGNRH